MKTYILTVVAICLAGCSNVGPRGQEPLPPRYQHAVKLESDPPGMRVYFGTGGEIQMAEHARSFIGITPCETKIKCSRNGLFEIEGIKVYNSFRPPVAAFMAEPPFGQTNLFRQDIIYNGEAHFHEADKVPDAVFFDMHKKP